MLAPQTKCCLSPLHEVETEAQIKPNVAKYYFCKLAESTL